MRLLPCYELVCRDSLRFCYVETLDEASVIIEEVTKKPLGERVLRNLESLQPGESWGNSMIEVTFMRVSRSAMRLLQRVNGEFIAHIDNVHPAECITVIRYGQKIFSGSVDTFLRTNSYNQFFAALCRELKERDFVEFEDGEGLWRIEKGKG